MHTLWSHDYVSPPHIVLALRWSLVANVIGMCTECSTMRAALPVGPALVDKCDSSTFGEEDFLLYSIVKRL